MVIKRNGCFNSAVPLQRLGFHLPLGSSVLTNHGRFCVVFYFLRRHIHNPPVGHMPYLIGKTDTVRLTKLTFSRVICLPGLLKRTTFHYLVVRFCLIIFSPRHGPRFKFARRRHRQLSPSLVQNFRFRLHNYDILHFKLSRSRTRTCKHQVEMGFAAAYRPHLSKIDKYSAHDFFTRQAFKVENRGRANIKGFAEKWKYEIAHNRVTQSVKHVKVQGEALQTWSRGGVKRIPSVFSLGLSGKGFWNLCMPCPITYRQISTQRSAVTALFIHQLEGRSAAVTRNRPSLRRGAGAETANPFKLKSLRGELTIAFHNYTSNKGGISFFLSADPVIPYIK